jgi:hypothetical protein
VLRQLVRPSATELKAAFAELVPTA